MENKFNNAVKRVKIMLDKYHSGAEELGIPLTQKGYRQFQLENLSFAYQIKNPNGMLLDSIHNPDAFDALKLSIATQLDAEEKLPLNFKNWIVRYLRGEIERPQRRAGNLEINPLFKKIIHECIKACEEEGLKATRNDSSLNEMSGCDAVAKAMKELDLAPRSFDRIKRIWQEEKKREKEWAAMPDFE